METIRTEDGVTDEQLTIETALWPIVNRERGLLIDKSIDGTITPAEQARLDHLQAYADYHLHPFHRVRAEAIDSISRLAVSQPKPEDL